MAYNDEALRAKLATLNETQESIVSVSQWIAFHRRYADKIAQVWLTKLKDSPPPKRLNYVYLVNDIVQNARARKRAEFPNAFSPIIAEAVQQAYRSSPTDIQGKLKRLLEVWKTRNVFEPSILAAIQARVDDVDNSKPASGKKTLMGNSLFNSSTGTGMPKELESLGPLQTAVTKSDFTTRPVVDMAQAEYNKINDPSTTKPSAPVYAANLSSLIKKLASAEASLTETITARKALVADLRRLLDLNEAALSKDEALFVDLSAKRAAEETNKRDVEDSIMRGLAETQQEIDDNLPLNDTRPDVEELTPEPEDTPIPEEIEVSAPRNPNLQGILAGFGTSDDISGAIPVTNGAGPSSSKKRKLSHDQYIAQDASFPDLGEMGVTGFDGNYDNTAASITPVPGMTIETPGFASSLEQDVEALIRANSGGTAG
ncbi:hypothetical protein LTS08_006356 [Lithohypha guttulata]|nr:hypothetical protein LTS08_006356 [Lithohypha guttulata]